MTINRFIRVLPAVAGIALLAANATSAAAQGTDTRWRAWAGCWMPVAAEAGNSSGTVCVVPVEGQSAVDIVSVSGSNVVDRVRIRADGEAHPVTRDGCTGTETAAWSSFGTRLFLSETLTCSGGLTRKSNGVMSFNQRFEWLDVRGVSNGAASGVAVARYEPVVDTAGLPAEVMGAMRSRSPATNSAVLAASAPLTLADIAEVSTRADSGVAATWLLERTQGVKLSLDGKQLTKLADQGVPPAVIDVLVAISYPDRFALAPGSQETQMLPREVRATAGSSRADMRDAYWLASQSCSFMYYDPWCYSYYRSPYSYRYSSFGYDRFGYGGGYGYGYGYPYYGFYPGSQPIIVVNRPTGNESVTPPHGRVVKGRGYTSGSSGSSGSSGGGASTTSSPSASSGGSSSSGGSASSGGSSGGSSAGSSGGSSSSGRTAVRKPPQ